MGLAIDRDEFDDADRTAFAARLTAGLAALRHVLARPGFGEGASTIGAEIELCAREGREHLLARQLATVADRFDYILIDCPPSLGLLTLNALVAADGVVVPMQAEYFALEGISELTSTITRIKRALNPRLAIEGVLLTMVDDRTNLSQQVTSEIREHFKDRVFRTTIPRSVRLGEAPSFGKPILLYDIRSRGAEAYLDLAKEIMSHEKKGAGQGAVRPTARS